MKRAFAASLILGMLLVASVFVNAAAPRFGVYTIRPGDTLWSISRRFNTTVASLQQLNPGLNALRLVPGQEIKVGQAALEALRHTVKPGETLYSIARSYDTSVALLAELNHLKDANRLYVGQVLTVYAKATLPAEGLQYIVKRGDTLYGIAKRFYLTVSELVEVNNLVNPNQLTIGQRLIIPY